MIHVRKNHLLALIAALGVLLHAGMAAAQVFCAMTGTIATSCCCPASDPEDGPVLRSADACCKEAVDGPVVDLLQAGPQLPPPLPAAAWEQIRLPEPPTISARALLLPTGTAPPLLALQTIVLLR